MQADAGLFARAARRELRPDPRWTEMVKGADQSAEGPLHSPGVPPALGGADEKLRQWVQANVRDQRQQGYVTAAVTLCEHSRSQDASRGPAGGARRASHPAGYQPRSRHSARCGRSVPSVVSRP